MLRALLTGVAVLGGLLSLPQDPQKPAAPAAPAAAPADVASVEAITAALYDVISGPAGQKRDWDRMRSLFHKEARLVPMLKARTGGVRAVHLTVEDYVQRSGPMLEQNGFFEHEIARRVETLGDMAHVWSTYEGRKGKDDEQPFLRGINSIQLVREQGRWFVLQILWEQEADAGPIPAEYLPGK
ncbi:MAG TPA: hypothetical protein VFZ65_21470 [Planctomycetota bacterium]|nr:hypothetical protein [Planctomycetota bacterium]